jgi:hypothetical protein
MRVLSDENILRIWENGLRQHPVARAMTMLAQVFPELSASELEALSVGQRDACLLSLRKRSFGSQFAGFASCPQCQAHLEFSFDAAAVEVGYAPFEEVGQVYSLQVDDYIVQLRLPSSADQLALARCSDVAEARQLLLRLCIVCVECGGEKVALDALSERVIEASGEYLLQRDPQSEVNIDLTCPECGHSWVATFDVGVFLWQEIQSRAKRVMREVHTLAKVYGWPEADILAMSVARRENYLEMVF